MSRGFIIGVAGPALVAAEYAFLREWDPWGLILFERNVKTPDQLRGLIASFRDAVGRADAPVLVDQEGGRVQRLRPPQWASYPAAADFGALYDLDASRGLSAARLGARLIAAELAEVGITVGCLPIADLPVPGGDPVIGNRAYGTNPEKVAALAQAVANGLRDGGILPVVKHIPGHGRATVDSHARLPEVGLDRGTLETTDFAAFRALGALPLAMTAHVVFTTIDPMVPATISATIVHEVIRGSIGFKGLLMTDDISMGALSGTLRERAAAAYAAGCDIVLHCNGDLKEMQMVAAEAPQLSGTAAGVRAARAQAWRQPPQPLDLVAARAEFSQIMSCLPPPTARHSAHER
jgi:beta-N-acetylhexosaminidase